MLVVERGNAKLKQVRLVAGQEVQIGRHPAADLLLEDNRVSTQHALIRFLENGFTIVDLGSTNGTRVNGQHISQMRLQHNDRVEIGDAVLVFKQLR
jgi:pSer/pThr/pTyr-binding forkhead associated (FHA) protein